MRLIVGVLTTLLLLLGAAVAQTPPQAGNLSPEQLQQLVAPIALYPDSVVAQILAAATYPDEVQQADQWMAANGGLTGDALANAVNSQGWDSSVMALCEYPSVLTMMGDNLSWTSELGEAYYNQPDDVMDAVQAMRQQSWNAGILRSTAQQTVVNSGGIITIVPANNDVVYVPTYDPWLSYGPAFTPWYSWVNPPGWSVGVGLHFGPAFNIGIWARYPWSNHGWNTDWHGRQVVYNRTPYRVASPSMVYHNAPRGPERTPPQPPGRQPERPAPAPVRPGQPNRPGTPPRAAPQPPSPPRGAPAPRPVTPPRAAPQPPSPPRPVPNQNVNRGRTPPPARPAQGTRTSAFSGIGHGGVAAGNSTRGNASMSAPRAAPSGGGGRGRGR